MFLKMAGVYSATLYGFFMSRRSQTSRWRVRAFIRSFFRSSTRAVISSRLCCLAVVEDFEEEPDSGVILVVVESSFCLRGARKGSVVFDRLST